VGRNGVSTAERKHPDGEGERPQTSKQKCSTDAPRGEGRRASKFRNRRETWALCIVAELCGGSGRAAIS